MIEKFKSWIIHRLGGVTIEEHRQKNFQAFDSGVHAAFEKNREYARSLNGLQADEWCQRMYAFIDNYIEQLEKVTSND